MQICTVGSPHRSILEIKGRNGSQILILMTSELLIICKDSFLLAIRVVVFMVEEVDQMYLKEYEAVRETIRHLKEGRILLPARTKLSSF